MMYHCEHALIVYVPAYSLLHGCVAANLARMGQCHAPRLLHTKHEVTIKSTPQWSLGKRGPQDDANTKKQEHMACPFFVCVDSSRTIAVDKRGRCSRYIYIYSCLIPILSTRALGAGSPQQTVDNHCRVIVHACLSLKTENGKRAKIAVPGIENTASPEHVFLLQRVMTRSRAAC